MSLEQQPYSGDPIGCACSKTHVCFEHANVVLIPTDEDIETLYREALAIVERATAEAIARREWNEVL